MMQKRNKINRWASLLRRTAALVLSIALLGNTMAAIAMGEDNNAVKTGIEEQATAPVQSAVQNSAAQEQPPAQEESSTQEPPVLPANAEEPDIKKQSENTEENVQQPHILNVNYFYSDANAADLNGQVAAEPYYGSYLPNESFAVTSPAIPGYVYSTETVTGTMGETDIVVDVWYTPSNHNGYMVEHLFEKLDGGHAEKDGYQRQRMSGTTGTLTNAQAHNVSGFRASEITQAPIAADGSTLVQVFYEREGHYVYFHTNGGSYVDPVEMKFEEVADLPAPPVSKGFAFAGWYLDHLLTAPYEGATLQMGLTDINLYAKWSAETVPFKVVFWLENPNDDRYSYWNTQEGSGVADQMTDDFADSYSLPHYAYYEKYDVENKSINGDGSTVINIRYKRKLFTISFYRGGPLNVWDPNAWQHTIEATAYYTITAKVGQFIGDQWHNSPSDFFDYRWISESEKQNPWANWISGLVSMGSVNRGYVGVPNSGPHQYYIHHMFEVLDQENGDYDKIFEGIKYAEDPFYLQQFAYGDASVTIRSNTGANIPGFTPASKYEQFTADPGDAYLHNGSYFFNRKITTVSFDTLGGSAAPASIVQRYETDLEPMIPADPEKEGFQFSGWYTNASTEGASYEIHTAPPSSVMLFAKWTPVQYTVSFELNGGDEDNVERQQLIGRGSLAGEPEAPTREGYVFKGWYANLGCVGSRFVFDKPIYEDMTLYAGWSGTQQANYTVTYIKEDTKDEYYPNKNGFDLVGTTVTETAYYDIGTEKYAPDYASKSLALSTQEPDNRIEFLYRPFATLAYKVEYRFADSHDLMPEAMTGTSNPKLIADSELSRVVETYQPVAGYMPDLYQKAQTLTHETTANEINNNVITFYYTATAGIPYTVEHYLENPNRQPGDPVYSDTPAQIDDLTASAGQQVTAHSQSFAGHRYNADVSSATSSGTVVQNHTLVLRLYYDILRYTVSFNSQGGSAVADITWVNHGSILGALRPQDPTKSGYDFVSWNTKPNGGRVWSFNSDPVLGNITLYAIWQKQSSTGTNTPGTGAGGQRDADGRNGLGCCCCCCEQYAVFFDSQGGSLIKNIAKAYFGGRIGTQRPSDPVREGYDFMSWSTEPQNGVVWDFETDRVLDDMALYAVWREKEIDGDEPVPTPYVAVAEPQMEPHYCCRTIYTVTFDARQGSPIPALANVYRGSTLGNRAPHAPVREGYEFGYWSTAPEDGKVWNFGTERVFEDITLYAVWYKPGEAKNLPQPTAMPETAAQPAQWGNGRTCCCCCVRNHTVRFDTQGGSTVASITEAASGQVLGSQKPANPVKAGYAFVSWNTLPENGRVWNFDTDPVCWDLVLYAVWAPQNQTDAPQGTDENKAVSIVADEYQAAITLQKQTKIHLRKEPIQASTHTGTVNKDAVVTVLASQGEWALVRTENGAEGYIRVMYLTQQ